MLAMACAHGVLLLCGGLHIYSMGSAHLLCAIAHADERQPSACCLYGQQVRAS